MSDWKYNPANGFTIEEWNKFTDREKHYWGIGAFEEIKLLAKELQAERERAGRMREAVKDYLESYGCIGNDFNLERMRKELHEEALREYKW